MTLDRRITLLQPTVTQNNSGQVKRSFASAGTFYAQIMQAYEGVETFTNQQDISKVVYSWRLRYQTAIKASWKLQYDSENYDIVSIAPEGRKRYIIVKTTLSDV
jgi:SPP1 family predicted phage head-tail adaptor